VCVCVCVLLASISRANQRTNKQTSVVAGIYRNAFWTR